MKQVPVVTTCFYDLGLSWLESKHLTFHMRNERSINLMRLFGGENIVKNTKEKTLVHINI